MQFNTVESYFDHVFGGRNEIAHSGIRSRAISLDPQYIEVGTVVNPMAFLWNLKVLEEYAADSLMAYNAIEWYATCDIFWFTGQFPYIQEFAQAILARCEKPKSYMTATATRVEVE